MTVVSLDGNSTVYPPANLTLLAPEPGYTCGPVVETTPTVSSDLGGRRRVQLEPLHAPKALLTVTRENEEEMALKALWTVERKASKVTSGTSSPAQDEGNYQCGRLDGREEYLRGGSGLKDKETEDEEGGELNNERDLIDLGDPTEEVADGELKRAEEGLIIQMWKRQTQCNALIIFAQEEFIGM
ncbi:COBRA protein [Salix suchowensis]|nr:COBRA protein [Salix suchowensis]